MATTEATTRGGSGGSNRERRLLVVALVLLLWLSATSPTLVYLWDALTDAKATWTDTVGDVQDAVVGAVVATVHALAGIPSVTKMGPEDVKTRRRVMNWLVRTSGKLGLTPRAMSCAFGASCDVKHIPAQGNVPPLVVVTPKQTTACNVLFLNIHGGGWVFGEADDPLIYVLAGVLGCPVASVEYGFSPEVKFPVPVDESAAALEWVCRAPELPNRDRVVVVGTSAGGNLVAAVAHKVRSTSCAKLFVPIVPVLSAVRGMGDAKYHINAHVSSALVAWYTLHYVADDVHACARDPLCSPLAETNWASMPPISLIYAARDILGADAEAYAAKLRDAGYDVPVFALRGSHYAPFIRRDQTVTALRLAVSRVHGALLASA